ncbi:hypothetical protein M3M35_04205 [Fructilactobacillus myrtifloralis]|uniref:Polymerase nucleotidyl transferase domain-containing protein n=1 Tax=Fructilactobacillus myrtifloralis TaxID=2940301 RepID=A0ABY5BLY0_9LACO|nr:hypothetical protein [Fructilactobacillus myrtifloralis]USS84529.1 hypothetical protein M3M35_04205 [Fructilactobacillus myrtifloralis]
MIYERFFNTLRNFQDDYVLIGGNAASVLIGNQGGDFRQTQDYDIVVLFENIKDDFPKVFYKYIKENEYEHSDKKMMIIVNSIDLKIPKVVMLLNLLNCFQEFRLIFIH